MPSSIHHTGTLEMKSLALFSATLAVALPLIDAHSAQSKTSVKSTVQNARKRDRSARVSPKFVSYLYSVPSYSVPRYSAPSSIDRPICFIERSDGTFVDLSNLCGTKAKPDPLNLNSNSTMPSYPIYPEDRQPPQ